MLVRASGRRGSRDHRRERLGQEHARQDPDRRPPAGLRASSSFQGGRRGAAVTRRRGRAGVITVFQEVLVVGPRSVLDNVWLGTDGLVAQARCRMPTSGTRARRLLDELLGEAPPLDQPVEELSLWTGRRARSRARSCASRRSSSSTRRRRRSTSRRATGCSRSCARLAAAGTGVIFISHRMDEIEQIGDRITVMRSGETVATFARGSATLRELVAADDGRGAPDGAEARELSDDADELGDVVLERPRVRSARTRARSTSSCGPESSSASRVSRGTARTRSCACSAERPCVRRATSSARRARARHASLATRRSRAAASRTFRASAGRRPSSTRCRSASNFALPTLGAGQRVG